MGKQILNFQSSSEFKGGGFGGFESPRSLLAFNPLLSLSLRQDTHREVFENHFQSSSEFKMWLKR